MIRQLIRDFLKEEDGLAAVEYALLAGAVIAAVGTLTTAFNDTNIFDTAANAIAPDSADGGGNEGDV
ncbi:hypothetical protein [Salinisphaera sp. G21_0]|uniref:Flp family type IVb pilin n=1 Tax=Salinisphaera sp. G21_0 TaxID=2821094 RepID=UPI002570A8F1|nr:hypothetical protein [Salinisphaera sp. G21_0]